MKRSFLALSFVLVSAASFADIETVISKACETPQAKKLMGKTGSCRVVAAPKEAPKATCRGMWITMQCSVSFDQKNVDSEMTLTCSDQFFPMPATGATYNIVTLIKNPKGADIVIPDSREYSQYSNEMVNMEVIQFKGKKTGSVRITLESGSVFSLTNVKCI